MVKVNIYDSQQPATPRRTRGAKQYLPAATAAANQVGVVLVREFGQQGWILQAMEACREAVQNCIQMLSGTAAPIANGRPLGEGGQYAFPARTAAELQASMAQAAHAGQVSQAHAQQVEAAGRADAALASGDLDMFAVLQRQAGLQDPASTGMPPPEKANADNEWLL